MSDPIISPGVRGYLDGQAEAAERIANLERRLAEAQLRYAACSNEYRRVIADLTACRTNALAAAQERDALKATLEQAREALKRCLTRLKAERDMIEGTEPLTVKLDPKVHGMDALIPLLEAALDAGTEAGG